MGTFPRFQLPFLNSSVYFVFTYHLSLRKDSRASSCNTTDATHQGEEEPCRPSAQHGSTQRLCWTSAFLTAASFKVSSILAQLKMDFSVSATWQFIAGGYLSLLWDFCCRRASSSTPNLLCFDYHGRKGQSHTVPLNPTRVTSLLSLSQYFNGYNFLAFDQNVFRAVHLQILPLAFENKHKEQDNFCEASCPTIYSQIYTTSF